MIVFIKSLKGKGKNGCVCANLASTASFFRVVMWAWKNRLVTIATFFVDTAKILSANENTWHIK